MEKRIGQSKKDKIMAKRKTIKFEDFKKWINEQLARTDEFALQTPEFKSALCSAYEKFAIDTGNYNGFQYLYWHEGGCEAWIKSGISDCSINWKEKEEYIVGPAHSKYRGSQYARMYY